MAHTLFCSLSNSAPFTFCAPRQSPRSVYAVRYLFFERSGTFRGFREGKPTSHVKAALKIADAKDRSQA